MPSGTHGDRSLPLDRMLAMPPRVAARIPPPTRGTVLLASWHPHTLTHEVAARNGRTYARGRDNQPVNA